MKLRFDEIYYLSEGLIIYCFCRYCWTIVTKSHPAESGRGGGNRHLGLS